LALFSGLQAAILASHKRIHIEGDSKLLIDCIKGNYATPWRAKTIVENIITLLQKFDFVKINHVYREANSVADALVTLGHEDEDNKI
jgi:ribonuclease HI